VVAVLLFLGRHGLGDPPGSGAWRLRAAFWDGTRRSCAPDMVDGGCRGGMSGPPSPRIEAAGDVGALSRTATCRLGGA